MINQKSIFLLACFLLATIAGNTQPHFGDPATEIALPTVAGDTIKLSSLKGKVVLLDFWASWCGPCRSSNKHLAKLYPKLKEKGFEILGVSLDDDKGDWEKAIRKDKVSWLQVNEPGGPNAPVARNWNIYAIPTSYLLNKNGKLVAIDLEGKELEMKVKELLAE
ncbi:MAG TPA: TlpA disulfide reductase family protein [Chitinophagaceae bacterium]|nr:TlpA disulfide reductase family protein [Chitinophagaceae bacterium]